MTENNELETGKVYNTEGVIPGMKIEGLYLGMFNKRNLIYKYVLAYPRTRVRKINEMKNDFIEICRFSTYHFENGSLQVGKSIRRETILQDSPKEKYLEKILRNKGVVDDSWESGWKKIKENQETEK
ncbi:MAG: hypothetical protein WDZ69_00695 [Candidatus Pacearchaeota archaeon]